MTSPPQPPSILNPLPERHSLWRPITIAIGSTFALAVICCSGGGVFASFGLEVIPKVFFVAGLVSLVCWILSLLVAFFYFLSQLARKLLSR
jgi:hypothetical protein